jgi:glutaredoxin-like protein
MPLLGEKEINAVKNKFAVIEKKVKIILINPPKDVEIPGIPKNQYAPTTEQLLEEVVGAAPDKLELKILRYPTDEEEINKFYLSKPEGHPMMPVIIIADENEKDYGIRYYGIPAGYEFASLLEDIVMVGTGKHELNPRTVQELEKLPEGIRLWVFVTPTCPYCPRAVRLAHQMAFASDKVIEAAMIEALEFEKLSQEWQVYGVPKIVIGLNDTMGLGQFEGAVPEPMFLSYIKRAVQK